MKLPGRIQTAIDAPRQAMGVAVVALVLAAIALIYTVVKTHGA
jgi:hypothetical protein